MKRLEEFRHGDGAHCGLGDWYPEKEKALAVAIASGEDFTTGWYGSKKEIASANITYQHGSLEVEVSVSDDFDTYGTGRVAVERESKQIDLDEIRQMIYRAWDYAEADRKENALYCGFSIIRNNSGVETLILPVGWGEDLEFPPGDNYFEWGFQDGADIPASVKDELLEWAHEWIAAGQCNIDQKKLTVGEWTIEPWRNDND